MKCLLIKELLQESPPSWEGLDQRHQVRSSTKVMVGQTSFLSTFMSVHICAEVRHALGKGISCPALYPDPASAGSDKEDEQTAKTSPLPHALQLPQLRPSLLLLCEVPEDLTLGLQSQHEAHELHPKYLCSSRRQEHEQPAHNPYPLWQEFSDLSRQSQHQPETGKSPASKKELSCRAPESSPPGSPSSTILEMQLLWKALCLHKQKLSHMKN